MKTPLKKDYSYILLRIKDLVSIFVDRLCRYGSASLQWALKLLAVCSPLRLIFGMASSSI